MGDGSPQVPRWTLEQFLLIFIDRILNSSMDGEIPNLYVVRSDCSNFAYYGQLGNNYVRDSRNSL
jgi:hypothetical protein